LDRHRPAALDSVSLVLFRLFDRTTFSRGIFLVRLRLVVLEFAFVELSGLFDSEVTETFLAFSGGPGLSQNHPAEKANTTTTHDITFSLKLSGSDRNDHAKLRSRAVVHLHVGTTPRSISVIRLNGVA